MASRALLLFLSGLFCSALAASARADLSAGLIASYSFNGHTMDISGHANHGTPVGDFAYATDRFGNPDAAGEFNGVNSYVLVPHSATLGLPDTAITQAAWVHLYGASLVGQAFGPVTMKSTSTENAFMYRLIASPGGISSAFNNWNNSAGAAQTIPLGEWHHVATVYDGSGLLVYYDGARIDSVALPGSITPDTRDLTIGGDVPGILEIFNGRLDDVRIYDRALSDAEIAELVGEVVAASPPSLPLRLTLGAVSPNPTRNLSRLEFALGSPSRVQVWVQDARGRRVRALRSAVLPAGTHHEAWDGRDAAGRRVPPGLYFLRLQADDEEAAARLVRLP